MAHTQEHDVLRILVATDNHLGVWENDEVRRDDSFTSFEEVFEIAAQQNADFVLLGGDLFHDNKPSRHTVVRAMDILTRHCLSDRPITFQVLSDQKQNFTTGRVNFENPNFNVGLPVFTIHGNHDDPGGADNLSAVDILATGSLVNYFGKAAITHDEDGPGKVRVAPVLIQKGATRLALYGLGSIRDERMCRLFSTPNAVEWVRPAPTADVAAEDWFNVFVLHQNRVAHTQSAKNCVREGHLARFLDLVVWGHEHECLPDPWESLEADSQFSVLQPGSSVATALSEGESKRKHVVLLEAMGTSWRTVKFPLETVRPFVFDTVALAGMAGVDPDRPETVSAKLAAKVEEMIETATRGRGPRAPELPLIRLRVDYTGFSTINPQRFGQRFLGKVANPQDIIMWQKAPVRRARARADAAAAAAAMAAAGEAAALGDGTLDEGLIEDLISAHLTANLEILPEAELTDALREYVEKGETKALEKTVNAALIETQAVLGEEEPAEGAGNGVLTAATAGDVRAARKAEEKALNTQIQEAAQRRKVHAEEGVAKRRQEEEAKRREEAARLAAELAEGADGAGPSTAARGTATQRTATMRDAFDDDSDQEMAPPPARGARGRGRGRAPAAPAPAARKRRATATPAATPASRTRAPRPAAAAAKQKMSLSKRAAYGGAGEGSRSGDEDVDADALLDESDDDDVIEDSDEVMEEEEREMIASARGRGMGGGSAAAARKRGRGAAAKGVGTEEEPISLIDSDDDDDDDDVPSRGGRSTHQRGSGRSQLTSKWGGLK